MFRLALITFYLCYQKWLKMFLFYFLLTRKTCGRKDFKPRYFQCHKRELCFNCKHFMSCGIKGLVMCNRSTNIWSCQEAGEKLKEQGSDFWKYGIDFAIYGLERNYWSYVDVAEHEVNLSLAVLKNFWGVCIEDNRAFGGFSFL